MKPTREKWKLDRSIPIAVIIAIVMQVAGMLVWATELDARVGIMERQHTNVSTINEKFARLEERLDHLKQEVVSVRRQLDRITEQLLRK